MGAIRAGWLSVTALAGAALAFAGGQLIVMAMTVLWPAYRADWWKAIPPSITGQSPTAGTVSGPFPFAEVAAGAILTALGVLIAQRAWVTEARMAGEGGSAARASLGIAGLGILAGGVAAGIWVWDNFTGFGLTYHREYRPYLAVVVGLSATAQWAGIAALAAIGPVVCGLAGLLVTRLHPRGAAPTPADSERPAA